MNTPKNYIVSVDFNIATFSNESPVLICQSLQEWIQGSIERFARENDICVSQSTVSIEASEK